MAGAIKNVLAPVGASGAISASCIGRCRNATHEVPRYEKTNEYGGLDFLNHQWT